MLLADKGYDANALREAVRNRNAWANIPPKANRRDPVCFSKHLYKARNLVERFFNRIKQFRRIATRYDKLAEPASPDMANASGPLKCFGMWLQIDCGIIHRATGEACYAEQCLAQTQSYRPRDFVRKVGDHQTVIAKQLKTALKIIS